MPIILDVETIDKNYQFIYDIAWGVIKMNKLVKTRNYIVLENLSKMAEGCFSKEKTAVTMKEVVDGNAEILPFNDIMKILVNDFKKESYVYAYNGDFDRRAIINTCKHFKSSYTEFFEKEENFNKWRCLWAWASNTIIYKKSYIDFCEANKLMTPKGYHSTSAETVLKYLLNDLNYVESHTALKDIKDEFKIYLAIKKETGRDYQNVLVEENKLNFQGKPFFTIKKLERAIKE